MQSAVSRLNLDPTGGGRWTGFLFVGNCNLTSLDVHVRTGVKVSNKNKRARENEGEVYDVQGTAPEHLLLKTIHYPIRIFMSRDFTEKISCLVVRDIFLSKVIKIF